MFAMFVRRLTLGGRYFPAALVYTGLGLRVLSWPVEARLVNQAFASGECDPESPCPPGMICCQGSCIPSDYVCCEDGTSGPAASCVCCTGCQESSCTQPSTVACGDE